MNLALIAITDEGVKVAERIKEKLRDEVTVFLPEKIKHPNLDAAYFSKKGNGSSLPLTALNRK